MSSPVNENLDQRTMYAPPWAREAPQQSSEAIIAAVERLRLERQRNAAPAASDDSPAETEDLQWRDQEQGELPLVNDDPVDRDTADIEAAMAEMIRTGKWSPRSLAPVTLPEPPKPRPDGPTWGMVFRLGSAAGIAAIAALFMTGTLPLPLIEVSFTSSESPKAQASAAQIDVRDTGSLRQPVMAADASPSVPPSATTPVASTPGSNAPPQAQMPSAPVQPGSPVAAYASLDTQPAIAALKANPSAAAPPPKLPELRSIDRDELAGLIKRGQALLAEGDIASARLLLRRAAEAGDAEAALMLAGTYDRAELARLKVIGVAHDHAQAKLWYTRAVEHGSAEAVRRLQQLAQRAD
jgi:hypothetical protein